MQTIIHIDEDTISKEQVRRMMDDMEAMMADGGRIKVRRNWGMVILIACEVVMALAFATAALALVLRGSC